MAIVFAVVAVPVKFPVNVVAVIAVADNVSVNGLHEIPEFTYKSAFGILAELIENTT